MTNWLRIPTIIWGVATIFYAFEIMLKSSMGAIAENLSYELSLNSTQLASLSSAFYFTYIILQIPAGLLVDRFGVRRVFPFAVIAALVSSLIFSLAPSYEFLFLARILMGVCGAFGFICAITLAVQWFSIKKFALLAGLTNFFGYLGGSLSGLPMTLLVKKEGVQVVYLGFAVISVVILILGIVIIRDKRLSQNRSYQQIRFRDVLKNICSADIITNGLFCATTMGATFALCDLWGREFLESLGYSVFYAALAGNSLIFIGIAISAPIWGWLAGYINTAKLLAVGAMLGFITSCLYLYVSLPVIVLCILALCIGASQSSHILSFSYVHNHADKEVISAIFAFVNLCGIIGGALVQLIIGIMFDYGISNELIMAIIPILFFIALMMTFVMRRS